MSEIYKNILIIKPSALGDIIHSLPILHTLKSNWPDAKITWFVRNEFAPLIEEHTDIDELIIFKRKLLGKFWCNRQAFGELVNLIKTLRNGKFDIVFDLQGLFRTAMFAWLSGCKKRFGMANAREIAHLLYTNPVKSQQSLHVIDYHSKIMEAAGAKIGEIKFNLPVHQEAADYAEKILGDNGIEKGKYVVLVPGSAQRNKCWPIHNFARLAELISNKTGYTIMTVGTEREKEITAKLMKLSKVNIVDFAGRTDIPQLTAIMKNAVIVISNDTGPGYIADALDVPVVLIYGPTNASRVAPYGKPEAVAAVEPYLRGSEIQSNHNKHKIESVSVELVFEKFCQQLGID